MALTAGTIFAIQATATTGNINGSGFNPANANFPVDLAATSANTASPVVTSATYNFVAGDVGAWVYVKSGTNWVAGWYQIVSVAANAATLSAAIGAAVLTINAIGVVTYNTTAGCATTASPTGGTFGVDYSQQDTAQSTITDAVSVGASTTLTSLSNPWTPVSVGNFFHLTTTGVGGFGVVGWYEIVSYNTAGSVVTDRTTNSGTALAAGTGQTGGAGRFNGLEDTFKTMIPAASICWVKNGTYTFSTQAITASTNSTATNPSFFIGFNTIRGDTCNGANRPIFAMGANQVTWCQAQNCLNLIFTGTATTVVAGNVSMYFFNCQATNTSATAARNALVTATGAVVNSNVFSCEVTCQNGIGINFSTTTVPCIVSGCYVHDCVTAISSTSANTAGTFAGNLLASNTTAAITMPNTSVTQNVINNTIYGRSAIMGIGINLSGANSPSNRVFNNILTGLATGISVATGNANSNMGLNNDFFNNTTDVTNWLKSPTDLALAPQFTSVTEVTGTTATTSGSTLTDAGASFITAGVVANQDFLHVVSGTGVTVACYLITARTATTLTTNNALGTSSAGNVVYWITVGHNFQIGTNLKGLGFPNFTNATGSLTTSYPDVGAVQRQESAAATTVAYGFVG